MSQPMKEDPVEQKASLQQLRKELLAEADALLHWWNKFMTDKEEGGFYGKVNNQNAPTSNADKGIVLNSRILWTFSAACNYSGSLKNDRSDQPDRLASATRAYEYIAAHFIDRENGGVYWSVDHAGSKSNGKKQVYGQAFCIYGLAEYFKASGNAEALSLALAIFYCIEKYCRDKQNGGYIEARGETWDLLTDLRLSDKDANEAKSMNTHLHVIEAYSNLYTIWKDAALLEAIRELLDLFIEKIIDPGTNRQRLFFDMNWTPKSTVISFGHDIEAAWLLYECAEIAGTPDQLTTFRNNVVKMANAAMLGLDEDGGLWHEMDPQSDEWIKEKHWWPQAEALVGFYTAWKISHADQFLHQALRSWDFIKQHLRDEQNGEWFWGVYEDYSLIEHEDKAGFWKCPYHNVRACLEVGYKIKEE